MCEVCTSEKYHTYVCNGFRSLLLKCKQFYSGNHTQIERCVKINGRSFFPEKCYAFRFISFRSFRSFFIRFILYFSFFFFFSFLVSLFSTRMYARFTLVRCCCVFTAFFHSFCWQGIRFYFIPVGYTVCLQWLTSMCRGLTSTTSAKIVRVQEINYIPFMLLYCF